MSNPADALRVQLARRIRMGAPREWQQFSNLWMAFNAIYSGEKDLSEGDRVMSCIRRALPEHTALRVLRMAQPHIDRVLEIPPGDLRYALHAPNFRLKSQKYASLYRNSDEPAVSRLAAAGGVLYQVRCNLIHGGKDPLNERDRMLVRESLAVLNVLVPELEAALRD